MRPLQSLFSSILTEVFSLISFLMATPDHYILYQPFIKHEENAEASGSSA